MRRRHYSIHTEKSYIGWIKRYIKHFKMESRDELLDGERKVEGFLTHFFSQRILLFILEDGS